MSRLGPLRERDFRLLFIGQTTSRLGSAMRGFWSRPWLWSRATCERSSGATPRLP